MVTGRRKLLVADDSPTVRKVITLTFEDEGMEVVAVGDGAEALSRLASETPPDVILADAVMPGTDGYELCERVKRDGRLRHVPVVLLVGTFEPFNQAEARRVGAETVLTKPFQSIRDLVSKVGSLIGGESKEAEGRAGFEQEAHDEAARAGGLRDDARAHAAEASGEAWAPAPQQGEPQSFPAGEEASATPLSAGDFDAERDPRPDHGDSFAGLGADDEMIEAKPADSYGTPAPETREAPAYAGLGSGAAPSGANSYTGAQAEYAFAARASAASTADDALLDLGGFAPLSPPSSVEADDFILDLDDEMPAPPAAERQAAESSSVDDTSAFAEASHGAGATSVGLSAADAAARDEAHDPVVAREVVAGYVPPQLEQAAPASSFEPEVVSAEEGQAAQPWGEFTEGSVEGDLERPPADESAVTGAGASAADSTVGLPVGEARVGVEEYAQTGRLTPEEIDAVARRVVELMSDEVVREIAWEVVPDLADLIIRRKLEEESRGR